MEYKVKHFSTWSVSGEKVTSQRQISESVLLTKYRPTYIHNESYFGRCLSTFRTFRIWTCTEVVYIQ